MKGHGVRFIARGFVAACLLLAGGSSRAAEIEIHGNAIVEYRDGEFPEGVTRGNSSIRLTSGSLILQSRLSDWNEVFFRGSYSDQASVSLSEAWFAQDGIGPGRITLGRFYRPRGAPIPTLNLPLPTRVFRSSPVIGIKYGGEFEDAQTRWEIGLTQRNPISVSGATIGDTFAVGRPNSGIRSSGPPEAYLHLGTGAGGDWGTVELALTGTYGRLMPGDLTTLANAGFFFIDTNDRQRRALETSLDYIYGPVRIYGDAVYSHEGDLRHEAWEAGATYRFLRDFRALVSYGEYRVNADVTHFARPWTWDRNTKRVGLNWEARPGVQIQTEYEWNGENTLRFDQTRVKNDNFALQVVTYW